MSKVFISYRRTDSEHATGRLYDYLAAKFGDSNIFIDVDNIAPGESFDRKIHSTLKNCDTVLVMIGDEWNPLDDTGERRRLDDPEDWVRTEVSAALSSSKKVIPVLIDDVEMPETENLPNELADLTRRNATRLRSGSDFPADSQKILEAIGGSWFRPAMWAVAALLLVLGVSFGVYKFNPFASTDISTTAVLLEGMALPPSGIEGDHPNLIVNDRIIGEKYGLINDQPWRRKPLAVSDDRKQEYFQPRASVINGELYVLYFGKAWQEDSIYLYELTPKTGDLHVIDELPYVQGSGYYFDDEANLVVRGEFLYYFRGQGNSGRKYKIGSREQPSDEDFFVRRGQGFYTSTSPNGRYIVAPNAGYTSDAAPEDYKLATRGQQQGNFSEGEFTGISLYDRKLDSNSVLFKQEYSGDWSIGNIVWADDNESLYFDNSGAVACIWKYTLGHRILQKIVPEHEARSPFFIRFEGRDYILYTETLGWGSDLSYSRVMITTE